MLKYLAIFAVILGLAIYIAREDERAAQQTAQKTANQNNAAVPSKPDENHPQQNVPNPEGYSPSWYGFFRWPNGTATWAILLTLLAIAEQSQYTAKSAKAAFLNAQALIDAERPWIVAYFTKSQEDTIPENGNLRFLWEIKNVGRTPARLTYAAARVVFNIDAVPLPDVPDYGEPDYFFTERILVPGGTLEFLSHWYRLEDGKYRRLYQIEDVKTLDLLIGFGCVKYLDTFNSGKEYVTRFSDSAMIGGRDVSEPFSPWMEAPAKYTECT
jgi:hypothetical protein